MSTICYSLTSFECILLESTFGPAVKVEAVESPAVGDTRWLCEAAAATGTENKDRKRGDALLKAEENTLAACVDLACGGLLLDGGDGMEGCEDLK
jgi:hypothetical protein